VPSSPGRWFPAASTVGISLYPCRDPPLPGPVEERTCRWQRRPVFAATLTVIIMLSVLWLVV
jgi:hypothetical protein